MSGWGMGWFGGGSSAGTTKKTNSPKDAILTLRGTHEMLMKREKHLQNQMEEQQSLARKYASTNQTAAKTALRRKKVYEKQYDATSQQIMTIENEISSIETANINKETFDAMRKAGESMKKIHNGLTPDKVEDTMDVLREQHAISEDISNALTSGAREGAIDDDELELELEELQQEELDNKMTKVGNVPVNDQIHNLPTAGTHEPSRKVPVQSQEEDDEDEELRRLQAEMALPS